MTTFAEVSSELQSLDLEIALHQNLSEAADGIAQLSSILNQVSGDVGEANLEAMGLEGVEGSGLAQVLGNVLESVKKVSGSFDDYYGYMGDKLELGGQISTVTTLLNEVVETGHQAPDMSGPEQVKQLGELLGSVKDGLGLIEKLKLNPVMGAMLSGYATAIGRAAEILAEVAGQRQALHEAIAVAGGGRPQAELDHEARIARQEAEAAEWEALQKRHDEQLLKLYQRRVTLISKLNADSLKIVKAYCARLHRDLLKDIVSSLGGSAERINEGTIDTLLNAQKELGGRAFDGMAVAMAKGATEEQQAAGREQARKAMAQSQQLAKDLQPVLDCIRTQSAVHLRDYDLDQPVAMGGGGFAGFAAGVSIVDPALMAASSLQGMREVIADAEREVADLRRRLDECLKANSTPNADWVDHWRQGPAVYTPDDRSFLQRLYSGAAAGGLSIAGISRISGLGPSVTGLGHTATLSVRVAADGRLLPGHGASSETADSILRIWVGPSTAPTESGKVGVVWVAYATRIDVAKNRVTDVGSSGPSTEVLEAMQDGRPSHEYANDPDYRAWYLEATAHSPDQAVQDALADLGAANGRLGPPE